MSPSPVVDVHAHVMPLSVLRFLEAQGRADLSEMDQGRLRIDQEISGVAPGNVIPFAPEQYDVATRRAVRKAAGISVELVSVPPFLFASQSLDPVLVMSVVRAANDALHEYVTVMDKSAQPLYLVPVGHPEAVDEARRCLEQLGGTGVTIGTYGMGRELDAPINEGLWSYLSEKSAFISLHPSRASEPERLRDYHLLQLFGYPVETALAASRLIFSGVLDRHDLEICLAHGGGCLLGVSPRLDLGWERKAVARTSQNPPTDYLQRFRFDTAVFDPQTLTELVRRVGADRVLVGTDFPFDLADADPIASVSALDLRPSERDAILGGNAIRLVPRIANHEAVLS